MLAATATRVEQNSSEAINQRVARETVDDIHYYAAHPERIEERLRVLDAEWDIERSVETTAAGLALTGLVLGMLWNRRFLALPVLVAGFLMQHALQGWCPPVPALRRMGVRSAEEIGRERMALKALRGDFQGIPRETAAPENRAAAALRGASA